MSKKRSSSKESQPEPVFFIDADLGDRIFHEILTHAGVRFERHDDHFRAGTDDLEWLKQAGLRDWIVVSHNKRLRWVSAQTERLMEAGVRAIMVMGKVGPNAPGDRSTTTRAWANNLVNAMPSIRRFLQRHQGPWIAKLYMPSLQSEGRPLHGDLKMWLTFHQWLKGR